MSEAKKLHSEKLYFDPDWKPPQVVYGSNLIEKATDTEGRYAVVSMGIPWRMVKDKVSREPEKVVFVPNMHQRTLEGIERLIPDDLEMVLGIGGGSSHDCAKFIAMKKNLRLIQVPTILGGDAVVTTAVGIRDEGKVRYIGHVRTDTIYVDFDILRSAPSILVRYGAADILSSFTGLLDWKLAADRGEEKYDIEIARYAGEELLGRLKDNAEEIKNITDQGIKTIIELFLEYHRISHTIATDRAQEGSEHFFAYNAEYVTKRTFVHGALLSLGIWISAGFFYDRREEIEDCLDSLGLEYTLESAGLSEEEFLATLRTLSDFSRQGGYYYSFVHDREIDEKKVAEILRALKA